MSTIDLMDLRVNNPVQSATSAAKPTVEKERPPGADLAKGFQQLLDEKVQDLVSVTQHSDKMDRDFAAGKTEDIHEVMVAAAQSQLAVDTALQVRNLAIRAYTTLTQLR